MISVKYHRKADDNIYLRCFPIPKQELKFYINEKVKAKDWDKTKQRVTRTNKYHKDINHLLDLLHEFINKEIRNGRIHNKPVTIDSLKKALRIRLGIEPQVNYYTFATSHILSQYTKNKISKGTYDKYSGKLKTMQEKYPNLSMSEISKDWVSRYIAKGRKANYQDSTISKELSFIKQILKAANGEGLHTNTIFNSDVMNMKYQESEKEIYLTYAQIMKIYYYKFPKATHYQEERHYSALRNAAKILVRACLTGQRYSDFDKLGLDSIQEVDGIKMIQVKRQQKGKTQVWIPLHPIVEEILTDGVYHVSNAKLNIQIKEVGEYVDIPNSHMIKTHTGRRSLATNLLIAGEPSAKIKLITGHSSDKAFNRYIRIDSLSNAMMMSKADYFNHSAEEAEFYQKGLKVV